MLSWPSDYGARRSIRRWRKGAFRSLSASADDQSVGFRAKSQIGLLPALQSRGQRPKQRSHEFGSRRLARPRRLWPLRATLTRTSGERFVRGHCRGLWLHRRQGQARVPIRRFGIACPYSLRSPRAHHTWFSSRSLFKRECPSPMAPMGQPLSLELPALH
jgi:hypothetical protein